MINLLIGKKAIIEGLKHNQVLSVHSLTFIPEIKKICDKNKIIYKIESKDYFKNFDSNHQGIIAYIKNNDFLTENFDEFFDKVNQSLNKRKIILVLDQISDTRNFGSIIRTANAFNIDGIIIKRNNQAEINEFVIKTSIGAIYSSNILKVSNLVHIIQKLKSLNFWTVVTTIDGDQDLNEMKFDFNTCLVIGNEDQGISQNIINHADFKVAIKMYGTVQSLNVAVATGIILNSIKKNHTKE
ncbi:MAG: 23S rRNA (guanosine(2251)-2'-O)-methyltransferase RlmB [Mycoplasmoidaceae bacterium]